MKTHTCIFSSSGGSPAACVLKGPYRLGAPWCFFSHPWAVLLASLNRLQLELNFFCPYRDRLALNMLSVCYHMWPVSLRNERAPSLSRDPIPTLLVRAAYFCRKCDFFSYGHWCLWLFLAVFFLFLGLLGVRQMCRAGWEGMIQLS